MGVKWMLRWRSSTVAGPGDDELLSRLLEAFDAVRDGKMLREKRFEANVHLMQQRESRPGPPGDSSQAPGMKDIWLVRSNDAPDTFYLVNRREHRVLEGDNGISRIVEGKMDYRSRLVVKLEGKCYSKGDFHIRLATATQTTTGVVGQQVFLGHALEVEYSPLSNLAVAAPVLQEFVSMLSDLIPRFTMQQVEQPVGSLEAVTPSYDKYNDLLQSFGNTHAAVLYAEVAVIFMHQKAAAAGT